MRPVIDECLKGCAGDEFERAERLRAKRSRSSESDGSRRNSGEVTGKKTLVGFVTDDLIGQLLGVDVLVESDSEGFVRWLDEYVRESGAETMVTEDLSTYKPVVEELGVEHQVCLAHVRKKVCNRLKNIE